MTDEHVWVTLADGKRLYVGKKLEPKICPTIQQLLEEPFAKGLPKRKRRQHPPPAPVIIPDEVLYPMGFRSDAD